MHAYSLSQTDNFSDWLRGLKYPKQGKTMPTKVSLFDVADYLDSEETIAAYLNEVLAEDDQDLLLSALDDIARARGMTEVAEAAGVTRPGLYKALKPGAKTGFVTIRKVISALGLRMMFVPDGTRAAESSAVNAKATKRSEVRAAAAASKVKRAVRRARFS